MTLHGPSRTIVVEPVEHPDALPAPDREPSPAPGPPERDPQQPQREEPAPA